MLKKFKIILLSLFGINIASKAPNHSSFFILAKNTTAPQGFVIPINYNVNHIPRPGDSTLFDNQNYRMEAQYIVDLFIQKNKSILPTDISSEKILKELVTWSGFNGRSADLILYAELLTKYKKINLENIFITGSGYIDLITGKIDAVESIFHKIDAAIVHGIKIFIFAERQKKDIENYCNALKDSGLKDLVNTLTIYYIDNIDQIENILIDIANNKKKSYSKEILNHIKNNIKTANLFMGGLATMDSPAIQKYINNKKEYGSLIDNDCLKTILEDLFENRNDIYFNIQLIGDLSSLVNKYKLTPINNDKITIIEKLLEKYIFKLDSFYKQYYEICLKKLIKNDLDILDI